MKKTPFQFIDLRQLIKDVDIVFHNLELKKIFLPYKNVQYILAVSGGPDSIFLCYLYYIFYKKNYIKLPIIFHFNHNLREDSYRDQEFVYQLSKKLKLPFYTNSANISKISQKLRLNLEETARIFRYRALLKLARKFDDAIIITGHHGDDYLETIFLRLIRGSSLRNVYFYTLRKIPIKISKNVSFLKVLSPLLLFDKEQILHVLHQKKIPYVIDTTNRDLSLRRNQIRIKLLPIIKDFGIRSGILWQKTHLNIHKFKNEIIHKDFLVIDKSLFYNLGNNEIKQIFDQITSKLSISPLNAKLISEFIHQSYTTKIFIKSKECIIESVRNQIWFINSKTRLLNEPLIENNTVYWYNQKRSYTLRENEKLSYLKIESDAKIRNHLKEILRVREIPKVFRYHIPYIKICDYHKIIVKRILLSFIPDQYDLYLNST